MSIQDLEASPIPLPIQGDMETWLGKFWQHQIRTAEDAPVETAADTSKHDVPLARVKKVMKCCEEVKMISAETPVLLSYACQLFTAELAARVWAEADYNKRRTIQRSDVEKAVTRSEMYDFLIDVLPRGSESEKERSSKKPNSADV